MTDDQAPSFSPTTKLTATSLVLGFGIASVIAARRNTMSRVRMMDVYGPSAHVKSFHDLPYRINGISDVYDANTWKKLLKPAKIPKFISNLEVDLACRGLSSNVDVVCSPILSYGRYGTRLDTVDGGKTHYIATPLSLIDDRLNAPKASYGLKIEMEKAARHYYTFNLCANAVLNAGVVFGAVSMADSFSGLMVYGSLIYLIKIGGMKQLQQRQNSIAEDRVIPNAATSELKAAFNLEAEDALRERAILQEPVGGDLMVSIHRFFSKEPAPFGRAIKLRDEIKKRDPEINVGPTAISGQNMTDLTVR